MIQEQSQTREEVIKAAVVAGRITSEDADFLLRLLRRKMPPPTEREHNEARRIYTLIGEAKNEQAGG